MCNATTHRHDRLSAEVPTSTPVGAAEDILDLPDAPTSQVVVDGDVEDDELAALRELEASMMAA